MIFFSPFSESEVFRGQFLGEDVALKRLKEDNPKQFLAEVGIAWDLKNPAVVSLYGITLLEDKIYAVFQFCSGGSLLRWLHANSSNC